MFRVKKDIQKEDMYIERYLFTTIRGISIIIRETEKETAATNP